jgi:hypothetical protein
MEFDTKFVQAGMTPDPTTGAILMWICVGWIYPGSPALSSKHRAHKEQFIQYSIPLQQRIFFQNIEMKIG